MFLLKSFFHNRSQKPQQIANTFDNNKIMIFFPCPVFYCQLGLYVHQKLLHTQNTTFISNWYSSLKWLMRRRSRRKAQAYTPIAFDERVTFWLQCTRSLPCACAFAAYCMRVRLRNGYTRAYVQIMQHTHTHKAVTGRVEAKKLLSRRRQSNYSLCYRPYICIIPLKATYSTLQRSFLLGSRFAPCS